MATGNRFLYIDVSELDGTIDKMRAVLDPAAFERMMYRTLKEVGNRAKVPIARAVQDEYEVKQAWVKGAMGKPKMSVGDGVQCVIPIDGHRGSIGGTYKASGGHLSKSGGKLKLRAHIVKSQRSTLPEKMDHQGGQPPFMANGVAFTRKTKERFPIVRVVGLGVPQMPINRAEPEVQKQIVELLEKRLEHNYYHMFGG